MPALEQTALELHPSLTVLGFPCALVTNGVACRTDTGKTHRIELEFTRRNDVFPTGFRRILVPFSVLAFLLREPGVPASEFVVRHVAVDLSLVQILHVRFVGEAGVRRNDSTLLVDIAGNTQLLEASFDRFQHGLQPVMFLPFPEGLGINDDLVFFVYRGHAVIALDRALTGGHLGTFIIGDVALHFLAPFPLAHPWAARL